MKKRIFSLILIVILIIGVLSLVACGDNNGRTDNSGTQNNNGGGNTCQHRDANDDNRCDHCESSYWDGIEHGGNQNVIDVFCYDRNEDAKCDVCGVALRDSFGNPIEYSNIISSRCRGAHLEIINEYGKTGEFINPIITNGKIAIINFWGVWCHGSLKEMADFNRIAEDYEETVKVYAIHTSIDEGQAAGYIRSNYSTWNNIIFALDKQIEGASADKYYTALGFGGSYPTTVILAPDGTIFNKYQTELHYDELKNDIEMIKWLYDMECSHCDADGDNLCDDCGDTYIDGTEPKCDHVDEDEDGLCDECGCSMEMDTPFSVRLVLDGENFTEVEGIQVVWERKGETHSAAIDPENATASAVGLDGTYNVTLHGLPSEYRYDANIYTATNSSRDIVIEIFKHITTKGSGAGLYADQGCIQISRLGAYTASIKNNGHGTGSPVYYEFTPNRSGTYIIKTICDTNANEINPSIDVYNGTSAFKKYSHTVDSGSSESSYTRNAVFEIKVDKTNVGQAFTFAIRATSVDDTYPVAVDFIICLSPAEEETPPKREIIYADQTLSVVTTVESGTIRYPEVYVGSELNERGETIPAYRFDGSLVGLNEDDGYYHLYNQATGKYDGPLLYAKITQPTRFFFPYTPPGGSAIPISFQNIEMPGNASLRMLDDGTKNYKAFIEGGAACQNVVGMEDCIYDAKGYAQLAANEEGVYPVTEELKDFLQSYAVSQRYFYNGYGWVETCAKEIYGFALYTDEDCQWLFACCYYS